MEFFSKLDFNMAKTSTTMTTAEKSSNKNFLFFLYISF